MAFMSPATSARLARVAAGLLLLVTAWLSTSSAVWANGRDRDKIRIVSFSDQPDPVDFGSPGEVSKLSLKVGVRRTEGLGRPEREHEVDLRDGKRYFVRATWALTSPGTRRIVATIVETVEVKPPFKFITEQSCRGRDKKSFIALDLKLTWSGRITGGGTAPDGLYRYTVLAEFIREKEKHHKIIEKEIDEDGPEQGSVKVVSRSQAPTVTIDSPASGTVTSQVLIAVQGRVTGTAPLSLTVNGVAVPLSGGTFSTTVALVAGANTITATVRDASGRQATTSVSVTHQSPGPTISITSPASGAITNQASIPVQGQVAGTAPLSVTVNGVAVPVSGGAFSTTVALAAGATTITAVVRDGVGRQATTSVSVTRDSVVPTISITSPTDGSFTRNLRPAMIASYQDAAPSSGLDLASFSATLNGAATAFAVGGSSASFNPPANLAERSYVLVVAISDRAGNRSSTQSTFTVDATPPLVTLSPTAGSFIRAGTPTLAATYADTVSGVDLASFRAYVDGVDRTSSFSAGAVQATWSIPSASRLSTGAHTFRAVLADRAGNVSDLTSSFTVDDIAPTLTVTSPADGAEVTTTTPTITLGYADNPGGSGIATSSVRLSIDGTDRSAGLVVGASSAQLTISPSAPLAAGLHQIAATVADLVGNVSTAGSTFTIPTPTPTPTPTGVPDLHPTPVDRTVSSLVSSTMAFLYTGPNAVQTGVTSGAIDPLRTAVLRGRVVAPSGGPVSGPTAGPFVTHLTSGVANLGGVAVTVLGHPELGSTMTHADGTWDMAVNGGGALTVDFKKAGHVPVQRRLDADWQNFAVCPDVVMTPLTTAVTQIDFSLPVQVARGPAVTDSNGTRTATLMFFQGTTASMVSSDGTSSPLSALNVRATEHTVGANGPNAMPAELPPQSAYTYCASFTVDEALAAGAVRVDFSQPVVFYQENFLNFPVGTTVPQGFYDDAKGTWVPSTNGVVLKVLSVSGGLADLDTDGSGLPASAATLASLGISDAERAQVASLYAADQMLWRAPLPHLSTWDSNWGFWPPEDAEPPKCTNLVNGYPT